MNEQSEPSKQPEAWAIVELMGHVSLAGHITKPGENGGLWQIDIPDQKGSYRTEFFGSQSVYRIRMVSEQIARNYAPYHEVIEYNAPIITREEHETILERAADRLRRIQTENDELRRRLTAINETRQLPTGTTGEDLELFIDEQEPDL